MPRALDRLDVWQRSRGRGGGGETERERQAKAGDRRGQRGEGQPIGAAPPGASGCARGALGRIAGRWLWEGLMFLSLS